jgi:hypothetical protein
MRSISRARSDYSSDDDSIIVSTASTSDSEDSDCADKKLPSLHPKPLMKYRSHLLHELPDDLRLWFAYQHVMQVNASVSEMAWRLRSYACISKEHHTEVIDILNRKDCEAVCMASTIRALPIMMEFPENEKNKSIKFSGRVQNLVNTYRHVHADLSKDKDTDVSSSRLRSNGVASLFNSQRLEVITIDFFEKSDAYFCTQIWRPVLLSGNHITRRNDERKRSLQSELIVEKLNAELKRLAKNGRDFPVFDLICKKQSFITFVFPLVRNLARHCIDIKGLRSMDLSLSLSTDTRALLPVGKKKAAKDKKNMQNFINHLATFIASNQSLEYLNLAINGLSGTMISPLATALEKNIKLRQLDLSLNPIGVPLDTDGIQNAGERISDGAQLLANALKINRTLTHLSLAACEFDNEAADKILDLLKNNQTLQQIDLTGNLIDPDHPVFADNRVVCIDEASLDSSYQSSHEESLNGWFSWGRW